jgi:hypothetical protein
MLEILSLIGLAAVFCASQRDIRRKRAFRNTNTSSHTLCQCWYLHFPSKSPIPLPKYHTHEPIFLIRVKKRRSIHRQRRDICTYTCLERATCPRPQVLILLKTHSPMPCTFAKPRSLSFKTVDAFSQDWQCHSVGSLNHLGPGPRIVHVRLQPLSPSSFHHLQAASFPSTGRGERTICNLRQRSILMCSFPRCLPFAGSVPDEAGPRVAAGVSKVDDQGQVAVVDGDLGETNDASDALLFGVVSYAVQIEDGRCSLSMVASLRRRRSR